MIDGFTNTRHNKCINFNISNGDIPIFWKSVENFEKKTDAEYIFEETLRVI